MISLLKTYPRVPKNKVLFSVIVLRLHRYPGLGSKSNTANSKLTWRLEDIPKCPAAKLPKENIHFEQDHQMSMLYKGKVLFTNSELNVKKTLAYN